MQILQEIYERNNVVGMYNRLIKTENNSVWIYNTVYQTGNQTDTMYSYLYTLSGIVNIYMKVNLILYFQTYFLLFFLRVLY